MRSHKQHTNVIASVGAVGTAVNIQNEHGNSRLGWLYLRISANPAVRDLTAQLQGRGGPNGDWMMLLTVTGATSGWINITGQVRTLRIADVPLLPQMRVVIPAGGHAEQAVSAWFGGGEVG